jgi:hypothetical protein
MADSEEKSRAAAAASAGGRDAAPPEVLENAIAGYCSEDKEESCIVECGFADLPIVGDDVQGVKLFANSRRQFINLIYSEKQQTIKQIFELADPKIIYFTPDAHLKSANQIGRDPQILVRVQPPKRTTILVKLSRELRDENFPKGSEWTTEWEAKQYWAKWNEGGDSKNPDSLEVELNTDQNGYAYISHNDVKLTLPTIAGYTYFVYASVKHQSGAKNFVKGSNSLDIWRRLYFVIGNSMPSEQARVAAAVKGATATLEKYKFEIMTGVGILKTKPLEDMISKYWIDDVFHSEGLVQSNINNWLEKELIANKIFKSHTMRISFNKYAIDNAPNKKEFTHYLASSPLPDTTEIPLIINGQDYALYPGPDGSQLVDAWVRMDRSKYLRRFIFKKEELTIVGLSKTVTFDLTRFKKEYPGCGAINLEITVRTFDTGLVGTTSEFNYITVNIFDTHTQAFYDQAALQDALTHEFGHMLMLANKGGNDSKPTRQANYYGTISRVLTPTEAPPGEPQFVHRAHTGAHCSYGMAISQDHPEEVLLTSKMDQSRCIMMGWLGFGVPKTGKPFCAACLTSMRKMDLSSGLCHDM